MSALAISLLAFACISGGVLFGIFLRAILPKHHVSDESKDAVKLGIGMIATMSALILALLIASAKSNFDSMSSELNKLAGRIILLDRVMAQYGPETREARDLLRRSLTSAIQRLWPEEKVGPAPAQPGVRVDFEVIQDQLRLLAPQNDNQRRLKSRALQVGGEIAEARWLLITQKGQSSIPMPFLVLLVFWLALIFATFGLFSPRNLTVIIVLIVCAFSAAGALFLVLELDTPYEGMLKLSSAPLRSALALLGGMVAGKP